MKPKGLRFRAVLVGMLTVAVVLGIAAWVMVAALRAGVRSEIGAQNDEVLATLAEDIEAGADVRSLLIPAGADGTDFVILDDEGRVLNASLRAVPVGDDFVIEVFSGQSGTLAVDGPLTEGSLSDLDDEALRAELDRLAEASPGDVFVVPDILLSDAFLIGSDAWFRTERTVVSPDDGALTLVAFSSSVEVDRSLDRLSTVAVVVVPMLAMLAGLALWAAVGFALRPVRRISDEAERIAPSTSGGRLPVPDSGDELADLTGTLNGMLDRLDQGLIRQRQFVADASHELRSPLTAVGGAAAIVDARSDLPSDLEPTVRALVSGAQRLERILDDLTGVAEGDLVAERREFDLADVVLDEVRSVEVREGVQIDTTAVTPGVGVAHSSQVGRAVSNLVANAVRHADSQVVVEASVTTEGIRIVVDDDGPGVAPDDRDRVFERFVRLDIDRSRETGGSGLGLALVKAIADAHDGRVWCESSPIGGARFVLVL